MAVESKEIEEDVRPVRIDCYCGKCMAGRMRPNGRQYMTHPVQFPHECSMCGHTETFFKTYPYIEYKDI